MSDAENFKGLQRFDVQFGGEDAIARIAALEAQVAAADRLVQSAVRLVDVAVRISEVDNDNRMMDDVADTQADIAAYRAIPLPAEPAMAVKVKPLVWNEIKAPVAVACVGVYLMSHDFDGWYWILTQQGRVVNMATKPDLELTTAKAAAQADLDTRIRAALEE